MIKSLFLVLMRSGRKRVIDLMPFLLGTKSENAWEASKHPRDKDGKFAEAEGKSGQTSGKRGKFKRSRKVLRLPTEEFARVQHAFMTDVSERQRKRKVLRKYIGNYRYTGVLRNDESGERDIVEKELIE